MKKQEAVKIDRENQKIMQRIVNQAPNMSTKKILQDYQEVKKLKKLKEKTYCIQVDKLIQRRKKKQEVIKSSVLPQIVSQSQKSPLDSKGYIKQNGSYHKSSESKKNGQINIAASSHDRKFMNNSHLNKFSLNQIQSDKINKIITPTQNQNKIFKSQLQNYNKKNLIKDKKTQQQANSFNQVNKIMTNQIQQQNQNVQEFTLKDKQNQKPPLQKKNSLCSQEQNKIYNMTNGSMINLADSQQDKQSTPQNKDKKSDLNESQRSQTYDLINNLDASYQKIAEDNQINEQVKDSEKYSDDFGKDQEYEEDFE